MERYAGLTDGEGLLDIEISAYVEELPFEDRPVRRRGELEPQFAVAKAQAPNSLAAAFASGHWLS